MLKRNESNPIVTKKDISFNCESVFNAGAVDYNGKDFLLLRVDKQDGYSGLLPAIGDGVNFEIDRQFPKCFSKKDVSFEDPRISRIGNICYIVVIEVKNDYFHLVLYRTKNFKKYERMGAISDLGVKNGALFPKKFGDTYYLLSRPCDGNIWISKGKNLLDWGDHKLFLEKAKHGMSWDSQRIGIGASPIETDKGWLIIYHGVKRTGNGDIYRLGVALTDLNRPWIVKARCREAILSPEMFYEREGNIPNVLFTCGTIRRGDSLKIFYGACDTSLCVAEVKIQDLLDVLRKHS